MQKDDDVRRPLAMVNDDYWPITCSGIKSAERKRLKEGVEARQGLNKLESAK